MPSLLGRVTRNLSWLFLGQVLSRALLVVLVAVVARGMGAASVGVLTVALGVVMVAVPLFALGQVEVLIRETAQAPQRARGLLAAARRDQYRFIRWLFPPLLLAVLLLPDPALRWTLLALAPYALLRVEGVTRSALFTGLDRMEVATQARSIELAVAVALVAVCTFAGAPLPSIGLGLSAGGAAGVAWFVVRQRHLPRDEEEAVLPSLLRQSLPFFGQGVALQLLLRTDTFLLAAFGVSKEEIGYYGVAAAVVWGLLAVPQLLAIALYPTFSRQALGDREPLAAALLAAGLGLAIGLAGALGVWLLRRPLVDLLFGAGFAAALPLLGRLLWALPAAGASMVVGVVTAAWRRQHLGLVVLAATLALSVVLNLLWVPTRGALGAAAAAVVAHGIGAVGNLVIASWPLAASRRVAAP
jgi:O-antigen/teichoic acid export membrane protein